MSNELEQRALENAADDHDRRHTLTPTPQVVDSTCTCPSGDGSLRWPCPQRPPTPDADARSALATEGRARLAERDFQSWASDHAETLLDALDPHPTPDVDVIAEVRAWLARWDYASLTYAWDELRAILDPEATQ